MRAAWCSHPSAPAFCASMTVTTTGPPHGVASSGCAAGHRTGVPAGGPSTISTSCSTVTSRRPIIRAMADPSSRLTDCASARTCRAARIRLRSYAVRSKRPSIRPHPRQAHDGRPVGQLPACRQDPSAGPADTPLVQLGRGAVDGHDLRVQQGDVRQDGGHLRLDRVQLGVRRLTVERGGRNNSLKCCDALHWVSSSHTGTAHRDPRGGTPGGLAVGTIRLPSAPPVRHRVKRTGRAGRQPAAACTAELSWWNVSFAGAAPVSGSAACPAL